MRTGEMRHRIAIEKELLALDAAGERTSGWVLVAVRYARLVRAPGREAFTSAQRQGRVPVVFSLRWLAGVTPGMRVVFDGRVHNILSAADPSGLKEELLLTTEELDGVTP